MRRALIVIILLVATKANAQPALTAPVAPSTVPAASWAKNPRIAFLLSYGITAAGFTLTLAADENPALATGMTLMYFGPSTGVWYAGELGAVGLGLRAAGGLALLHAISLNRSIDDGWPVFACTPELAAEQDRQARNAAIFFVAGGSLWLAGTAFDFVQAGRAARRWNARHTIAVAPTAHGIAIAGRF